MSEKYCLGCGVNLNLAEHEYCGFCKPRYVHTGETMANDLVKFKTVETSLRRQIKELRSDNKALLEALKEKEVELAKYKAGLKNVWINPETKELYPVYNKAEAIQSTNLEGME